MHFKSKLLEVGKIFFILNSVQILISLFGCVHVLAGP